ncbi:MAG: hypothetical protein ACFB0C_11115 [Leptolyngbyaceae cyanobacterium]
MAEVNCAVDCVNGCVLKESCPHKEYTQQAASFIENTSLDKMLEMADEAVRRKMLERASQRKWVIPEE